MPDINPPGAKAITVGDVNVFVEIGNSDNKLDQSHWAEYCGDLEEIVMDFASDVFGMYHSLSNARFQNACWHLAIPGDEFDDFEKELGEVREKYGQSSIALTQGDTVFVTGNDKHL